MEIRIIEEAGHCIAVQGMKFSHEIECRVENIPKYAHIDRTAITLASKDGGHNKFLESIMVWVDIRAKLKFWKQFDTYRVGVTKQSKSTMHSIMKRPLTNNDFDYDIPLGRLQSLNKNIELGHFEFVTDDLPEGYLQTRRVCMSYKVIRNIIKQRQAHRLPEWRFFIFYMLQNLRYPELLGGDIV